MEPFGQAILNDPVRDALVVYEERFLSQREADSLLQVMQTSAPFAKEAPVVFGKAHPVSRASCAFGDLGVSYRYSGVLRSALAWPAYLRPIKEKIEAITEASFNFVLCNLYPDGGSGLGWHSDDERDLTPEAPIASLSLGAARDFYMRQIDTHEVRLKLSLAHGSLLVMARRTQRSYQHQVPKRARCKAPRINLTFRQMLPSNG